MFKVGDVVRFKGSEGAKTTFPNEYRITSIEGTGRDISRHMVFFISERGIVHGGYYAYRFELVEPEKSKEELLLLKIKYLNERYQKRNLNVALG